MPISLFNPPNDPHLTDGETEVQRAEWFAQRNMVS